MSTWGGAGLHFAHLLVLQQVALGDGYRREHVPVDVKPVAVKLLKGETWFRGHKYHQPHAVRSKGRLRRGGSGFGGHEACDDEWMNRDGEATSWRAVDG